MTTRASSVRVSAVDLGATSGRVMACQIDSRSANIEQVHRFPNSAVPVRDALYWDILGVYREILTGLREVARAGPMHGIGIDSWAVDYGLLDDNGNLLGNPYSYRDSRTQGIPAQVHQLIPDTELYDVTGLQQLPFNTIYQLVYERESPRFSLARTVLLLPDLLAYWLTGEQGAERTNASTTGLYDARSGQWAAHIAQRIGIPLSILPTLRDPGSQIGNLLPDVGAYIGAADVPVIAVGSHDTASAVAGVPAVPSPGEERFAYISSGTWSLIGLELVAPVLSSAARDAQFTNETGVDGTVRFLKNVMGLWVLSECIRTWAERGLSSATLPVLLAAAADTPPLTTVVDINDPRLLSPGDMPLRIQELAHEADEPIPATPLAIVRTVLDSLALAYRRNLRLAVELAGYDVDVVHIVGGGSQNSLLCQLTCDAIGLPVLAGPTEAAALGNGLMQARSLGVDLPDLIAMRTLIRGTYNVRRYEPRSTLQWEKAARRLPVSKP